MTDTIASYKKLMNEDIAMSPISEVESNISSRKSSSHVYARSASSSLENDNGTGFGNSQSNSFSDIANRDIRNVLMEHPLVKTLFTDESLTSVRTFLKEMDDVVLLIPYLPLPGISKGSWTWTPEEYMQHVALSKLTRPTHIITTSGWRILLEWNDVAYLVGVCENPILKDWRLLRNTTSIPDSAWQEFDSLTGMSAKGIPLYSRDAYTLSAPSPDGQGELFVRILLLSQDLKEGYFKPVIPTSTTIPASMTTHFPRDMSMNLHNGMSTPPPPTRKASQTSVSISPGKLQPSASRSALFSLSSTMIESLGSIQVIPSFFGRSEVVLPPLPTSLTEFSDLESIDAFMTSINRPGRSFLINDIQKTISDMNTSVQLLLNTTHLVHLSTLPTGPSTSGPTPISGNTHIQALEKSLVEVSNKFRKEMNRLKILFHKPVFDDLQKDFDEMAADGLEMYCIAKLYPGFSQLVDIVSRQVSDQVDNRLSTLGYLSIGNKELQLMLGTSFTDHAGSIGYTQFLHRVGAEVMIFATSKVPCIMLESLVQIHYAIAEFAKNENSPTEGCEQSADDLLHVLVQLLIRLTPRQLYRQIAFLKSFFNWDSVDGHTEYCFVNFEAAVCFIRGVQLAEYEVPVSVLEACGPPFVEDGPKSPPRVSLANIKSSSVTMKDTSASNEAPATVVAAALPPIPTTSVTSPTSHSLFSRLRRVVTVSAPSTSSSVSTQAPSKADGTAISKPYVPGTGKEQHIIADPVQEGTPISLKDAQDPPSIPITTQATSLTDASSDALTSTSVVAGQEPTRPLPAPTLPPRSSTHIDFRGHLHSQYKKEGALLDMYNKNPFQRRRL